MHIDFILLLILLVGLILMYVMPDERDSEFEEQIIPFRTDGEWSDKDNL